MAMKMNVRLSVTTNSPMNRLTAAAMTNARLMTITSAPAMGSPSGPQASPRRRQPENSPALWSGGFAANSAESSPPSDLSSSPTSSVSSVAAT